MRDSTDHSHLYHDSHFCSLSGVLEAREHLKAREVNAREQRLLQRQDRQLQQAKTSCLRRHSWEQDSVRQHLRAILERTPTFDRSLKDEQWKMHTGQSIPSHECAVGVSDYHVGKSAHKSLTATLTPLTSVYDTLPKPIKGQLSPITTTKTDRANTDTGQVSNSQNGRKPGDLPHNHHVKLSEYSATMTHSSQQFDAGQAFHKEQSTETDVMLQPMSMALGHKYSLAGQATPIPASPGTQSLPAISSASKAVDMVSQVQCRGARLCRRSHNAVMTIVHAQARHRLRKLQSDMALQITPTRRRSRPADQSSMSLSELSKTFPDHMNTEQCRPPLLSDRADPSSKLRWQSLPISMSDVTETRHSPHERKSNPGRPRFYSAD